MKNYVKISVQQIYLLIISAFFLANYSSCSDSHSSIIHSVPSQALETKPAAISGIPEATVTADAATILNRPQVPILCYHQIRDWTATDSRRAKDYIVPLSSFRDQMKFLADNGYHSISPDQLYDYLLKGKALPSNPIMITFDDSRLEQYTVAREEMNKYGFKGVFFIMTVSLGRPGYMSKQEVKQLADEGNTIGSHTWNHSNVRTYSQDDWAIQVGKPSKQLEEITGQPIEYFAYPFGLWNRSALEQIKERGFKGAFQLSAKRDEDYPQFCIRRIIVPGEWSVASLQKWMKQSF
jgi:peptidoglycan/xylan/chitin deacetylase (PgdA/CDA1 family)